MEENKQNGPIAQSVKAVKLIFATKKAAVAAYALFFGVTAATANYVAGGMTADEIQRQQTLETTIAELTERAEAYARLMDELESEVVDLQALIIVLNTVHETTTELSTTEHVVPYHEHPPTGVFGHEHSEVAEHEHNHPDVAPFIWVDPWPAHTDPNHTHDQLHSHKAIQEPIAEEPKAEEHTHNNFTCSSAEEGIAPHEHTWDPLRGCRNRLLTTE